MIHKTSDVDLIKRTIERLFRVGINVKGYFIFGFETEKIEDMQMTYDLARQLIDEIVYNGDLSTNIGRKQFNFTSGNFSETSDEDLRKFITETNGINQ